MSVNDMSEITKITEAIRMNVIDITESLSLDGGTFLDKLYQHGHLTHRDCQLISSRQTTVDKIRMLIIILKSSSPDVFKGFMSILESTPANNHLYEKIKKSLTEYQSPKTSAVCVICLMTNSVSESHVADLLWHEGILPNHLYDEIYFREQFGFFQRGSLWFEILNSLIKLDMEVAVDVMRRALGKKYSHIGDMLQKMPRKSPFQCCCCKRRQKKAKLSDPRLSVDSPSEFSTTSSREQSDEIRGLRTSSYTISSDNF